MARATRNVVAVAVGLLAPVLPSFGAEGAPHWSYGGSTGPSHWGTLEQDYGACGLGKTQSPIDIRDDVAKQADLPAIRFDYKPTSLKMIDNGHTIEINYEPGSFITVGDKRYELLRFHFHKPSEEKINGKSADMVAHLVHRSADGNLAVVAVLLESGSINPLVRTLWAHLPHLKEKGTETVFDTVSINAADLLPTDRAYYTFTGSLTTPPCTEGVTWFVLKSPTSVSADEIARFARLYPMNARPVQALNGRTVEASR
jgi:carbonic anhydrase